MEPQIVIFYRLVCPPKKRQIRLFYELIRYDTLVKNKDPLGFVPQPNLQVTVINQHLSDTIVCLLANPIFYERIRYGWFDQKLRPHFGSRIAGCEPTSKMANYFFQRALRVR